MVIREKLTPIYTEIDRATAMLYISVHSVDGMEISFIYSGFFALNASTVITELIAGRMLKALCHVINADIR